MKKLEDLTLKEFEQYNEILNDENFNIFELMDFFGVKDAEDMDTREFNKLSTELLNLRITTPQVKKVYDCNGKKLKAVLEIKDVKAAQFVDFQTYMVDYKLHEVLAVFLLPIEEKKILFGLKKRQKVLNYNSGYDLLELQNFIYENFKIGDAMAIVSFFLELSVALLPIIQNSLMMEVAKIKTMDLKKKKDPEKT